MPRLDLRVVATTKTGFGATVEIRDCGLSLPLMSLDQVWPCLLMQCHCVPYTRGEDTHGSFPLHRGMKVSKVQASASEHTEFEESQCRVAWNGKNGRPPCPLTPYKTPKGQGSVTTAQPST